MREVPLRMNEQQKSESIKRLVETKGNKKRYAIKLDITVNFTVFAIVSLSSTI